ncbi:MAG: toll/interleukin-1 receptor domain-containing protein [Anaerolineae bacterium]|nr:MAG: toll/interleukin-1 receptor domain-containing protein [Anaerolineae bacterium]
MVPQPDQLKKLEEGVGSWNAWRLQDGRIHVDLRGADLQGWDLRGVDFLSAALAGADLSGANLAGARFGDANLNQAKLVGANLQGADMRYANLAQADLSRAILSKAHIGGANCTQAKFIESVLVSADFHYANLRAANLMGANLTGAKLHQSQLIETIFTNVDVSYALFWGTVLSEVDLSTAKGLETCIHHGPSSLDYQTLERSGALPLPYLRGCGLPDVFIEYLPSLLNQPIQHYSCFISFSSQDQEFVERIRADLQDNHVRCWFAPEDMKMGDEIRDTLTEAIRLRDKLLIVLSEHSLRSHWVKDEVEKALAEERLRNRTVLFPLRLDDAVMESNVGWAGTVRQRHIADFGGWQDDSNYKKTFDRLMRDLMVSQEPGD